MAINPEAGQVSNQIGTHAITGNKCVTECANSESYLVLPSVRELMGEFAGISGGDYHLQGDYQYPIFRFTNPPSTWTRTFAGAHYSNGGGIIWNIGGHGGNGHLWMDSQTKEFVIKPIFEMHK